MKLLSRIPLLLCVLGTPLALAASGLSGIVTDPQGSVVIGATISIQRRAAPPGAKFDPTFRVTSPSKLMRANTGSLRNSRALPVSRERLWFPKMPLRPQTSSSRT